MLYVDEASGFFGGTATAGDIKHYGLIRASLGVPAQWQPKVSEHAVRWYCFECGHVHGMERCWE